MKTTFKVVLAVCLVFTSPGISLQGQDASSVSTTTMERCVNWMKATVPAGFILSPVDFCSGHKNPGLDGWYSIVRCGPDPELLDGTAPKYCTSSGQIGKSEAWAAGFRSGSSDGHELLDGGAGNPQNIAVTFYSRTPVWMGSLRLPAGMYDLKPAKSSDGWSLTVAKQDGADLGKLEMKVVDPNNHDAGKGLAISTRPWADNARVLLLTRASGSCISFTEAQISSCAFAPTRFSQVRKKM